MRIRGLSDYAHKMLNCAHNFYFSETYINKINKEMIGYERLESDREKSKSVFSS